jgi:putative pyruvate formate lyase activating enzyme
MSQTADCPGYLNLFHSGELKRRVEAAVASLADCTVCPRDCHVDRLHDDAAKALCRTGRYALVGSHFPHFGEEDCLRGWNGSGTIFFSFCNCKCVFCQNWDLSWEGQGSPARPDDLARMMLDLQKRGCHNINFVTPEHVVPQMLEGLYRAIELGLRLPIVSSTTPRLTTAWKACGCSMAWWTSTCPTSSSGTATRRNGS